MSWYKVVLVWLLLICVLTSCSRLAYKPDQRAEVGLASWYGPGFHGQKTSSGEIFDQHDLTAAHRSWPFGSYVLVTNLENNRSIVVRINDRGPFVKGRIIDLSYGAARVLGLIGPGTAPVRLELLGNYQGQASSADRKWFVQVGAFSVQESAYSLKKQLESRYQNVIVTKFVRGQSVFFRVRIIVSSRDEAQKLARSLAAEGFNVIIGIE